MNIVGAMDTATKGTVMLDGHDISDLTADELTEVRCRTIGLVFQQFHLIGHLTALENIEPGAGGEYQLTDGYARMIGLPEEQGGGLYGVVIDERRFDTGDKLGYLEANVTLALEDPALGAELKEFLRSKLED